MSDWRATLKQIGGQLDDGVYPTVGEGGVVQPSDPALMKSSLGKEQKHVRSQERRSAARSWEGSAPGQGTTNRARSSDTASSFVRPGTQNPYEIVPVEVAYPGTVICQQEGGIWLKAPSSLLSGSPRTALFVVALSTQSGQARGWAFWGATPVSTPVWIGPRHTNFPDGSICAFEPLDGTWLYGDSLVGLIDLYTLWAVRHLYLEIFGRWPGYQSVPSLYERVLELGADEHCGCKNSSALYRDCCRDRDLARDLVSDGLRFLLATAGGMRRPPVAIVRFANGIDGPPPIMDLVPSGQHCFHPSLFRCDPNGV